MEHLNLGNFEGPAGASTSIVRRLTLAKSLIYVAWNAQDKDKKPAIAGLLSSAESSESVRTTLKENFDSLLFWLILNERADADEQATTGYAPYGHKSPATVKVREISELITPLLSFISDSDKNTQALKIALASLMDLVKAMNTGVLRQLQSSAMGLQVSHRLTSRANAILQNLLRKWLVSESIVRYFVFELDGFDFLLETIGTSYESLSQGNGPASGQTAGEGEDADMPIRDQSAVG